MKDMKINTILQTKDGLKIGNALIVARIDGKYTVKTDYGNYAYLLSESEINELFYIGEIATEYHKHFI